MTFGVILHLNIGYSTSQHSWHKTNKHHLFARSDFGGPLRWIPARRRSCWLLPLPLLRNKSWSNHRQGFFFFVWLTSSSHSAKKRCVYEYVYIYTYLYIYIYCIFFMYMFTNYTHWKLTYPLKIDGWKTKFPFKTGSFSGDMLYIFFFGGIFSRILIFRIYFFKPAIQCFFVMKKQIHVVHHHWRPWRFQRS